MCNRLFRSFVIIAAAFFLLPFSGVKEARAEGVINYVFTGHAIPEGQSAILTVDEGTIETLRQNPGMVNIFVAALAERYDTSFAVIDQKSEIQYLSGVLNGTVYPGVHIPAYIPAPSVPAPAPEPLPMPEVQNLPAVQPNINPGVGQALPTPVNMDINSGTYIDVNLTTQTLTLYQNGTGAIVTPIVTGRGRTTPQGVFAVQYKQLNRTLKGDDYEAFVHYWMRIVNNVGIHDASWRGSFGGEIYKTNGSHGCINVPPSVMPSLYAACPEGMPVWVHG